MPEPLPKPPPSSVLTLVWEEIRALLDAVLDFSFTRFVTPRLIRTLYGLTLLAAALFAVTWMFSGFSRGLTAGLFTLVTGPLAFLIYILSARVVMEVVLALFRIAEHIEQLSQRSQKNDDLSSRSDPGP